MIRSEEETEEETEEAPETKKPEHKRERSSSAGRRLAYAHEAE